MIGFNYRRVPAIALARELVPRLGQLRHVRASYLQDWLVDPAFPLTWRLEREHAGSGALGDLGAHIVDLAQYLTGELVTGVSGLTTTFVGERPRPDGTGPGPVTVDDAALFTARLGAGIAASFEATRFASGRKNGLRIELNGERGSLAFDLERLNELEFHDHTEDARTAGFRRILVTEPTDPYISGLVAAGARAGLGAHVHPRGRRPGERDQRGHRPGPVVRRRPPGAAGAGRGAGQRRA